jgi:predicted DNA-binding protein
MGYISLRLSDEIIKKLEEESSKLNIEKSELIRRFIVNGLEGKYIDVDVEKLITRIENATSKIPEREVKLALRFYEEKFKSKIYLKQVRKELEDLVKQKVRIEAEIKVLECEKLRKEIYELIYDYLHSFKDETLAQAIQKIKELEEKVNEARMMLKIKPQGINL